MSRLKNEIETLEKDADLLISQAGFALRNTKGFEKAVDLVKRSVEVTKKLNNKVDALQEMISEK